MIIRDVFNSAASLVRILVKDYSTLYTQFKFQIKKKKKNFLKYFIS